MFQSESGQAYEPERASVAVQAWRQEEPQLDRQAGGLPRTPGRVSLFVVFRPPTGRKGPPTAGNLWI